MNAWLGSISRHPARYGMTSGRSARDFGGRKHLFPPGTGCLRATNAVLSEEHGSFLPLKAEKMKKKNEMASLIYNMIRKLYAAKWNFFRTFAKPNNIVKMRFRYTIALIMIALMPASSALAQYDRAVVSLTRLDYVYYNIDNPMSVSVPGLMPKDISVNIGEGVLSSIATQTGATSMISLCDQRIRQAQ